MGQVWLQPAGHRALRRPGICHVYHSSPGTLDIGAIHDCVGNVRGRPAACARFLRALACVIKEDDATPNCAPEGFADDQQGVRAGADETGRAIRYPGYGASESLECKSEVSKARSNSRAARIDRSQRVRCHQKQVKHPVARWGERLRETSSHDISPKWNCALYILEP